MFLKLSGFNIMLKVALGVNAIFSAFCALSVFWFQDWLVIHIPIPDWLVKTIVIALLIFSAQLILMVIHPSLKQKLTLLVVSSDISWVVVTFAGLVTYWNQISYTGSILITTINLSVAGLGWMQYWGFRQQSTLRG